MGLLKQPMSRELVHLLPNNNDIYTHTDTCHGQIATLLTDLGYSQAEVSDALLFDTMAIWLALDYQEHSKDANRNLEEVQ